MGSAIAWRPRRCDRQITLDVLDHGAEEAVLGAEVVRERPPGDPGPLDDLLLAGAGEAPPAKRVRPASSRA